MTTEEALETLREALGVHNEADRAAFAAALDTLRAQIERQEAAGAEAELADEFRNKLHVALRYVHCCGYRQEDPTAYPHVTGCPLGDITE